jgi:TrmH family RNA methyltransferase
VQHLRRLCGQRKARQTEERFVVEGAKLVHEALSAGASIHAVFIDVGAAGSSERHLALDCARAGADLRELQAGVLARACDTVTPQPIAAIVNAIDVPLEALRSRRRDLMVVCAAVRDPGNLGTIIRSAGAAGAGGVVCCAGSVDLYNPKAVRASAGALFHVPVVVGADAAEVLTEMRQWGLQRWGTSAHSGRVYTEEDLAAPTALVLGNEASGLAESLGPYLDGTLHIGLAGGVESLNVASTAAVICFEANRQRTAARSAP